MSRYAEGTAVPAARSQAEISETLRRYGATGFAYGWEDHRALIAFKAHGRQIRFLLDLPDQNDPQFTHTPTRMKRTPKATEAAYEAEVRRRWRCLTLAIKAKLECVETGISTFEEEFATRTVLPDGSTVADHLLPEIQAAYETGGMPPSLLPGASTRRQIGGGLA